MNQETKIETYLRQLDGELDALPTSQRAEIITEIKSHIRDALEQNPAGGIDAILAGLGRPHLVAAKYVGERGLTARSNRSGHTWFKWLAIGTVGFFAFVFVASLALVWYFSPLIKVDEARGRVSLFGGLIDVNEDIGQIKVGDMVVNDSLSNDEHEVTGTQDLKGKNVHTIKIPFNTAKMEIASTIGSIFSWDCKAAGNNVPKPEIVAGILTLNLDQLNLAKCSIKIPSSANAEIRGVNGHMDVEHPLGNVDIALTNGKVNVNPDPSKTYDFEVKVKNGLQDFFPRSKEKGALRVKVDVVNGLVKKE